MIKDIAFLSKIFSRKRGFSRKNILNFIYIFIIVFLNILIKIYELKYIKFYIVFNYINKNIFYSI